MSEDQRQLWERIWRRRDSGRFNTSLLSHSVLMIRDAAGRSRGTVLDWGCGSGGFLEFLGSVASHVVGADVSRNALQAARHNLDAGGTRLSLLQAPLRRLPFRSNSFSGIVSMYAINHDTRKGIMQAGREFVRVLRPGGWLVIGLPGTSARKGNLEIPKEGIEKGIPHYRASRSDLAEFLAGLDVLEIAQNVRGLQNPGRPRVNWLAAARKPRR